MVPTIAIGNHLRVLVTILKTSMIGSGLKIGLFSTTTYTKTSIHALRCQSS
jgi:hypothetical protein